MIEAKPENDQAVANLLTAAAGLNRGDVLSWQVVEQAIGTNREMHRFWNVVNRFRRDLRNARGIVCRVIDTVGLRLLTESEQVRICSEDRRRKMYRQGTRAQRELEAVPVARLSLVDRKLLAFSKERLRTEKKAIRASIKEVVQVRKANDVPRRKVAEAS